MLLSTTCDYDDCEGRAVISHAVRLIFDTCFVRLSIHTIGVTTLLGLLSPLLQPLADPALECAR
jgi:hypothetical protein